MTDPEPAFHVVESEIGRHLLVVDGSRLYDVSTDLALDGATLRGVVESIAPVTSRRIDGTPLAPPPLQTLSLNVAQACNMSCGYCYAGQGEFGGTARLMPVEVARAAVDRLIADSRPGAALMVGFMGGEPFLNRSVLHDIMPYAEHAAGSAGRTMRFSLTTNATLLVEDDVKLLHRHDVQVAVSIDGPRDINDAVRPLNDRGSAYDRLVASLGLFRQHGRPHRLSARITVTPASRDLPGILSHVLSLGFEHAGFSPVLVSPTPRHAFSPDDFQWFLAEMKACGKKAKDAILAGTRYPFSNFETALHEIHRGSHRPYPCGAGAAYLSVDADGGLFSCHRLVGDPRHCHGDVWHGTDDRSREDHLGTRHVDRQDPCRACWARYLCGGGCYHEVDRRGRPSCDYIRGWLDFCLASYVEIAERAPGYFCDADQYFERGQSQHSHPPHVDRLEDSSWRSAI